PPEAGPVVEVVRTESAPAVGEHVFFALHGDRVSLWTGSGAVTNLPLDERIQPVLADNHVRKITYDLKQAMLTLRRHGMSIAPPYDDPLLMAYLLFPNRGKYELPEMVFDLTGQTVAEGEEPTPWIERLFNELRQRTAQEVHAPYRDIELP